MRARNSDPARPMRARIDDRVPTVARQRAQIAVALAHESREAKLDVARPQTAREDRDVVPALDETRAT